MPDHVRRGVRSADDRRYGRAGAPRHLDVARVDHADGTHDVLGSAGQRRFRRPGCPQQPAHPARPRPRTAPFPFHVNPRGGNRTSEQKVNKRVVVHAPSCRHRHDDQPSRKSARIRTASIIDAGRRGGWTTTDVDRPDPSKYGGQPTARLRKPCPAVGESHLHRGDRTDQRPSDPRRCGTLMRPQRGSHQGGGSGVSRGTRNAGSVVSSTSRPGEPLPAQTAPPT